MITKNNTVAEVFAASLSGKGRLNIRAERPIHSIELTVFDENGSDVFRYDGNGNAFSGEFDVKDPVLWSLQNPHLYDFTLHIEYANESERVQGRIGFRTVGTDGKHVCLNGKPVYVRGFIRGATAHDHADNCRLGEEEHYRKNIRAAKKYGFNFVRFHSVVPSETFFKVADEEGILVHIEMRPPGDVYDNLREMTDNGHVAMKDDYVRQVVQKLTEHPSLCVYCIGNEIRNFMTDDRCERIYRTVKSEDDTRLFLDTCAWGRNGRKNVDIDVQHMSYYFPYGKHADMFDDTESLLVVDADENMPLCVQGENARACRALRFNVPLLAHEVCHYTALRDYDALQQKFARYGSACPWWVEEEKKMIAAKGYAADYAEMYAASKDFQAQCWKTAFEAMRRSSLLGGYHFLQFADTDVYENSNGVVDCFDDENAVTPAFFAQFNADRVLLADLGNRLFTAGEEIAVPVSLSSYASDTTAAATLSFTLTDSNGKEYARGALQNIEIAKTGTYKIAKLYIRLPFAESSRALVLRMRLSDGENICAQNEWRIWCYAPAERFSYRDFVSYENGNALVTDDMQKALDGLRAGKRVCLLYRADWTRHVRRKDTPAPAYAFRASWNRFKPVIWDRGTNYGGICENDTLEKYGFATGRFFDFNFGTLAEDCDKIILDDFPCKVHSLVRGIDKSSRDRFDAHRDCFALPELMYDRTLRDFSYLFTLCVGEGRLMVCGLNLTGLDSGEPSSQCMARFLLEYLRSPDFAPQTGIDLPAFTAYLRACASSPVKERMMTQFWALDDSPVESKQYWEESKRYLTEEKA